MAVRATSMNPGMLVWAREHAGLSVAELAGAIGKEPAVIQSWESGETHPTLRQLENTADKLGVPLAVFFFSNAPAVPAPRQKFRSLPEAEDPFEARDTSVAVREAHARQLRLRDLCGGTNYAGDAYVFRTTHAVSPSALRTALGATVAVQKSWPTREDAFNEWRLRLEGVGIVVFKRSFKQPTVSGFCLPDPVAPVIVVNNSTTWARQIFTLFHEFCHLGHEHHGVTRADHDYLLRLLGEERTVEVECNQFAAEFLIPDADVHGLATRFTGDESQVEAIATEYNVSREVVLRRLLGSGRVSRDVYSEWTSRWNADFFARPKGKGRGGGNYYATTASYLGPTFLRLAFQAYERGDIDVAELSEHLGVKARNLAKLQTFVEGRS